MVNLRTEPDGIDFVTIAPDGQIQHIFKLPHQLAYEFGFRTWRQESVNLCHHPLKRGLVFRARVVAPFLDPIYDGPGPIVAFDLPEVLHRGFDRIRYCSTGL